VRKRYPNPQAFQQAIPGILQQLGFTPQKAAGAQLRDAPMALATEMEHMYRLGMLTPTQWILQAVGTKISVKPLIEATAKAVKVIGI
jgi:hypothetical protein